MEIILDFCNGEWLGRPVWLWLIFIGIIFSLLFLDLGILHKKAKKPGIRESLIWSAFYVLVSMAFGAYVWMSMGDERGMEFFTGYAMELSLSLDNIFVISLIFSALSIPAQYQHRVLFWGIIGVLILRGLMIGFGTAIIAQFHWVLVLFGIFLLFTGIKILFFENEEKDMTDNSLLKLMRKHLLITQELHGQSFFIKAPHPSLNIPVLWATPLFVALVLVEVTDLIFAVDSIPAIFAVTLDPYVIYTSNIFAVLGLRSFYFALAAMVHRFVYLSKALSLVLIFIGGKLLYSEITHNKFPIEISLAIVLTLIISGVVISLFQPVGKVEKKD